ncbi:DUF3394 domain-containing protein, partial [Rhodovulum sulfidophilum]|nr:DUF3394 domain-containing protein [Rhodovulum sulfidophilum]
LGAEPGDTLRLRVAGPDFLTLAPKETTLVVTVGTEQGGPARLAATGLLPDEVDGRVVLEEPMFGTPFSETLQGFDFYGDDPVTLTALRVPQHQWPQELVFLPALALLAGVVWLQRSRARREGVPA